MYPQGKLDPTHQIAMQYAPALDAELTTTTQQTIVVILVRVDIEEQAIQTEQVILQNRELPAQAIQAQALEQDVEQHNTQHHEHVYALLTTALQLQNLVLLHAEKLLVGQHLPETTNLDVVLHLAIKVVLVVRRIVEVVVALIVTQEAMVLQLQEEEDK